MSEHNLTLQHQNDWALFLPAISSFYISGVGKQMAGEEYFESDRIPKKLPSVESLNFLDRNQGIFFYEWGLYSAGHANLDVNKDDPGEDIIRKRDPSIFMLGDSGGFQILQGVWAADWKNPACPKAAKKRKEVLTWMDTYMNYGMCLDIPARTYENVAAYNKHQIGSVEDAITATHINNEYFINNRNGNCKFLNALHGNNHQASDEWYEIMKKYCDPKVYPERHFNGWAMGGQNKIDIHLSLRRLIIMIHDGLLEPGKHDIVHYLGTSMLEWACMLTSIQRAIRKYHNPELRITFDCASPFMAAAKGLAYNRSSFGHNKKWTYSMEKTAGDKNYSTDTRNYRDGCLADKVHTEFVDSPISELLTLQDICYRGHGFIGKHGKETKTAWDSMSYTLLQGHNAYRHLWSVQEANRRYQNGEIPAMLMHEQFERVLFEEVVDEIFSLKDREKSLALLDQYSWFWNQFKAGSQGVSGRKTVNASTCFGQLFSVESETTEDTENSEMVESDTSADEADSMMDDIVAEL